MAIENYETLDYTKAEINQALANARRAGLMYLLFNHEVSLEPIENTTELVTLKSYILAANSFSKIMVEATCIFGSNIVGERSVDFYVFVDDVDYLGYTVKLPGKGQLVVPISHIFSGFPDLTAGGTISIKGQMSMADISIGCPKIRVYGIL